MLPLYMLHKAFLYRKVLPLILLTKCVFLGICSFTSISVTAHSNSWDSLIRNYIRRGDLKEALALYGIVHDRISLQVSDRTFVALLKACTKLKDVSMAKKIHAKVSMERLLQKNIFIGSTLVDTYAKCGALADAQEVFELLPNRDVVTWTALISGYAQHEQGQEALLWYEHMQVEGVAPNALTFACGLKACGNVGALDKGEEIHVEIADRGLSQKNVFLGSALINMYAKCGLLEQAREVFDELPVRDVACWNAMITAYAQHEQGDEALTCYNQMQLAGLAPDAVTFASSLRACGSTGALHQGIEFHAEIARRGLLQENFILSNALADMYGKCGDLQKAEEMFYKIDKPSIVSWTALIASYAEHECSEEALAYFERMRAAGVAPQAATFALSLKACGNMGAIDKGKELHDEINTLNLLKNDVVLANAVLDMYCKSGMPAKAQIVLNAFSTRTAVLWTTLISGYAQIGDTLNAFQVFDRMIIEGAKPSAVTFVSVLSACSHVGLIDEGQLYFKAMLENLCLLPSLEHHSCVVDLFSRAGQLDNALEVALRSPCHPSSAMWLSVLGGCRKWGDAELGRRAFQPAVELGVRDSWPIYICMHNIFAEAGMQTDADKVEAMRREWASSLQS